jgi:hypothetical protein
LPIQARSGLVQEDQNARLGYQLHANCDPLPLLDAESITHSTDKSICQVMELEKINNRVNILELICLGGVAGLAQEGREFQCFSHGCVRLMNIQLLTVSCHSLESHRERTAINHDRAFDSTVCLALSKHVKQCGFPCAGRAHEGTEHARFDPTVNVI